MPSIAHALPHNNSAAAALKAADVVPCVTLHAAGYFFINLSDAVKVK